MNKLVPFLSLLIALRAVAGPVEFGMSEFNRALAARGLTPQRFRIQTEITVDPPESYRIELRRVTGGDLRGLMYGLLEAADQMREYGHLLPAKGTPATPLRGIRIFLHNAELEKDWYYSRAYWDDYLGMLARNRFNRFNLVFAHQTNYLAPPYPYWIGLPDFPDIRAHALTDAARTRNLEMLQYISQSAADHGIDFTLGIWEHNIQTRMTPTVSGLTRENIGPYSYAALKTILAKCPLIRSVQMRTNAESGIPKDQQVEFYRDYVYRAIREAGRRVVLDLRGWVMSAGMLDAAKNSGLPLRLSSKYWAEFLGRPYQPAETFPNYSYINFLEKPRPYDFYWEVWALGSHRLLLWGDPEFVRRAAPTFGLSGSVGFEIDPPLAQKGFGNRPGKWGIFTAAQKDRVFWKYEFERYWLFYMLWGRLSYDPKATEKIWMSELKRRFGLAAPDVFQAYKSASGVLSEIVATHMADPNMYVWPEINPGGLIDVYKDVRPSDWRTIATIPEAVGNRIRGVASAKQTPADTAARLDALAVQTETAVEHAAAKLAARNREWASSEPDFRVLAMLARYHARKQIAAGQLTYFYETGDAAALRAAKQALTTGLGIWEKLAKFTDPRYPREMAFGPDDIGHWSDKLPYVRHDLKSIEEREAIFQQFGMFDFGFDFGGAVEPRFRPVDAKTRYDETRGYGWVTDAPRETVALPPTPRLELRSAAQNPQHLPQNALFGDSIGGRGAQTFRVKTGDGDFQALFLHPDRTLVAKALRARNGVLDVVFPEGDWSISGLILKGPHPKEPPPLQKLTRLLPRPRIDHVAPKQATAGKPLILSLRITPPSAAKSLRLYYRPLNQLAQFKMLESDPTHPTFTIPPADVNPRWDLMYYFEILTPVATGWFDPDPAVATPYYVVSVER